MVLADSHLNYYVHLNGNLIENLVWHIVMIYVERIYVTILYDLMEINEKTIFQLSIFKTKAGLTTKFSYT